MAVTTIEELPGNPGAVDNKYVRTYSRSWRVTTTDPLDRALTVLSAVRAAVPRYYISGNDTDSGAFIQSMSAVEEDPKNDKCVWIVTADYSSAMEETDTDENPLKRRWERSFGFEQYQRLTNRDVEGNPLQTSAGEDFATPIEVEESRPQLVIKRNELYFNVQRAVDYQDAVNSDYFFGAAPGTAKIKSITADERVENLTSGPFVFFEVSYTIQFNKDGWTKRVLDQGLMAIWDMPAPLPGRPGKVKKTLYKIKDKDGQPITKPALLDGQGYELEDGLEPSWREFNVYRSLPFAPLNLVR